MRSYALTYKAVAKTVETDIFEVVAPAAGVVELLQICWGQSTDVGDAAAESLDLTVVRGYSTSGSGGASATPLLMNSSSAAAGSTCETNNTTVASTGSPVILHADCVDIQAGYSYTWLEGARPTARNSERIVVRLSAPADSITQSATLYFREL